MTDFDLLKACREYLPGWLFRRALRGEPIDALVEFEATILIVEADAPPLPLSAADAVWESFQRRWIPVVEQIRGRADDILSCGQHSLTAIFFGPTIATRLARAASAGAGLLDGPDRLRCGLADGFVSLFTIGDARRRRAVCAGAPLRQALHAARQGTSRELWAQVPAPGLPLGNRKRGFARVELDQLASASSPDEASEAPWDEVGAARALIALRPFLSPSTWETLRRTSVANEQRPLTALFLRLGSADEELSATQLVRELLPVVTAIERGGGFVQQVEHGEHGTVVQAVFGAPTAVENASGRALAVAIDLVESMRAAAAVASGTALTTRGIAGFRRELTPFGEPLDRAERILRATPAGQVWCSQEIQQTPGFEYRPAALVRREPHPPIEPLRALSNRKLRTDWFAAAELTALIGRDVELERVRVNLMRGFGPPVAFVGSAGIGKSRMLREVARLSLQSNRAVCLGRFGAARPFSAFVDLANQLGETAKPQRDALLNTLARSLKTRGRQVTLLFEDLDLADPEDAAPWNELVSIAHRSGAIIYGTSRTQASALPFESMELQPLPIDQAMQLAQLQNPRLSAGAAARIARRAGGNPLFVLSLAQQDPNERTALPATVAEAIRIRFDQLEPQARRVLHLGAVWGEPLSEAALALLAKRLGEELSSQSIDELRTRRFLIEVGPEQFRFAHALERSVAYESIPRPARIQLHRAALELLQQSADADPAERLRHVEALGDAPAAAEAAEQAAHAALDLMAAERAIRFAKRALEASPDSAARCRLEGIIAQGLCLNLQRTEGARLAAEVEQRAQGLGMVELAAEMAQTAAAALSYISDYPASNAAIDRGLALVEREGSPRVRGKLLMVRGWNDWGQGAYPPARERLKEALQYLDPESPDGLRVRSSLSSILTQLGYYDDALACLPPASVVFAGRLAHLMIDYATVVIQRADLPQLCDAVDRAVALAAEFGDQRHYLDLLARRAVQREMEGQFAEGFALRAQAIREYRAAGTLHETLGWEIDAGIEHVVSGAPDAAIAAFQSVCSLAQSIGADDEGARAQTWLHVARLLAGQKPRGGAPGLEEPEAVLKRSERFLLSVDLEIARAVAVESLDLAEAAFDRVLALCAERGDRRAERSVRAVQYRTLLRWADAEKAALARDAMRERLESWGVPAWLPHSWSAR